VRFGENVYSPLIEKGTADYIVSFELLEVVRKLDYLSPRGKIIVNKDKIDPAPVEAGLMEYPEDVEEWIGSHIENSQLLDTTDAVKEAGSRKALNIIMLGALSNHLEFEKEDWEDAIRSLVKEKFVDMNLKAFNLGRELE
jgi:indolepyruvate ferredoxin oxidoreductase beta subunit